MRQKAKKTMSVGSDTDTNPGRTMQLCASVTLSVAISVSSLDTRWRSVLISLTSDAPLEPLNSVASGPQEQRARS